MHYSYIRDVKMFCHSYRCSKCGKCLRTTSILLRRHEQTCHGGVRYRYPGGVYHHKPSVFKQLEDEDIDVEETLRYYPYRATFDFECYFDIKGLSSDSVKRQWRARHELLSVSLPSNIPGYEAVQCFDTVFPNDLKRRMITALEEMSAAVLEVLQPSYRSVYDTLSLYFRRRGKRVNRK